MLNYFANIEQNSQDLGLLGKSRFENIEFSEMEALKYF